MSVIKNKLLHNQSLLFSVLLIITIFVTITSAIFTFLLINYRTKNIIECADSKLLTAVELNREIIGLDYHDNIKDSTSVSAERFKSIVENNDRLCRKLELQYLWSVLRIGDNYFFTSATHSDINDLNSACAAFFEQHQDPQSFSSSFSLLNKPSFSTFNNEWGKGRQVLVSREDIHGRVYISGASVALEELDSVIYSTIINSIGVGFGIICIAYIFAFVITRKFIETTNAFIDATVRIADGDLDVSIPSVDTRELNSLFSSIERMRSGLKLHIASLRESEQKYRLLHESSGVGIGYYTPSGIVISFNKLAIQHMNGELNDFAGKSIYDLFPVDEADFYMERISSAVDSDTPHVYEDKINLPTGVKWFHSTFSRVVDPMGEVIGIQIVSSDISKLKKVEEDNLLLIQEKELLVKEVHHRIKNNMNSIKGLVSLHLNSVHDNTVADSLRDVESRVNSMSILYEKLYCNENYRELPVADYLHPLAEEIVNSFPNRASVKVVTAIDEIILNFNQLTPLGIILNEMLTNIMKYAFIGRDEGLIIISVVLNNNQVVMIVQDNGVGLPESVSFEQSTGFGMQLISMLTDQIGGSIRIERDNGTKFIFSFII